MKVLMLSWEYPPHNVGGLGKHVTELVPALARAGVDVHLLTPRWVGGMGEEVIENVGTIHRVEPPVADMSDFFTGAWRTNVTIEEHGQRLLAAGGFDLIHAHDGWSPSLASPSSMRTRRHSWRRSTRLSTAATAASRLPRCRAPSTTSNGGSPTRRGG